MAFKLTQEQKGRTSHLYQKCPSMRFTDKLKALLLLDKGFSCVEVSDNLLLDDDTLHTPCKADVEKQERFVEEYRELKDNLPEKDRIYFVEGIYPQNNTITNYGWITTPELYSTFYRHILQSSI